MEENSNQTNEANEKGSDLSIKNQFFQKIRKSKKQHPLYQSSIRELERKNYQESVRKCTQLLDIFPKSYSVRCILAFAYRYLDKYDEALFYLDEAIKLTKKKPIAWYIRGEILFKKKDYRGAIDNLNNLSITDDYKAKTMNLYIILGLSYLYQQDYNYAQYNFNVALQNDPNNRICLRSLAYVRDSKKEFQFTLNSLDRLLNIDKDYPLILCYYGEILFNLKRYDEAIIYFSKVREANPRNIHASFKSANAYFHLERYQEALSDINKAMQLDPSNVSLIYIRCKTYIVGFKNYREALSDFDKLAFKLNFNDINSLIRYSEFWSYLCNHYNISDNDFSIFGDFDNFNMYMYKARMVYHTSNIGKISSNLHFQDDDFSLTGKVVCADDSNKSLMLPMLQNIWQGSDYHIVWKINIRSKSSDGFVKFIIKTFMNNLNINYERYEHHEHKLENLSGFPENEWFEYVLPFTINTRGLQWIQPSIEINGGIDLYVDYVRFTLNSTSLEMSQPSPIKEVFNVPEAVSDEYFLKNEVDNLLRLKDIINYL